MKRSQRNNLVNPESNANCSTILRRQFIGSMAAGVGSLAMADLLGAVNHFAPKAKRVIYLFQSGAPSQIDLFDHKPGLRDLRATELPDSIRRGQRLTGMTAGHPVFQSRPASSSFPRGDIRVLG